MQSEITRIFLMVMTTFFFVALIVPFIKKIAIHVGALDIPNKRKVHSKHILWLPFRIYDIWRAK